ncbi:hypothetical protein HNY73_019898 [Argiope bruennichi]|uniref:Uncharacterized protein n=1 Tax=Argiope bruennichi TaxID=94029 RepID=A0A8T0E664_ARGBR|nr:hypothetical protein HNY73_019898 [Argiope bruennichi]
MPSNVQSILTAMTPLNATKAAEMVDRILEVTLPEHFEKKLCRYADQEASLIDAITFAFESAALLCPRTSVGILKSSKTTPRSVLSLATSREM